MRNLLFALALLLAPACAISRTYENEPLAASQLAALQPGKTTAREVVEQLGAPVDIVQLGHRSAYLYQFSSSKRAVLFLLVVAFQNEDSRSDRAWLFFDEEQVLTHFGVTLQAEGAEYAMPWENVHE